jgi:hypothetical protein
MTKKRRVLRPNFGGTLRGRIKKGRRKFLYVEVTKEEKNKIQYHCVRARVTFSQYLAEVMLADAAVPKPTENVKVNMEFEFTPDQYEKLQVVAMLRDKKDVKELTRELLQESLDIQKMHSKRKRDFMRFYLTQDEHAHISSHIAAKNMPAGKYATMVVLRALDELEQTRAKEQEAQKAASAAAPSESAMPPEQSEPLKSPESQ